MGSNLSSGLGGPREHLDVAVQWIAELGRVVAVSSYLATAAEIYTDQPDFLNAALLLETELGPLELMHALLGIEGVMGRVRTGIPPKGPRVIDLDLIFFDAVVMKSDELTLPHPGVAERGFVLRPLAEIAGDWVEPMSGRTVASMLAELEATTR